VPPMKPNIAKLSQVYTQQNSCDKEKAYEGIYEIFDRRKAKDKEG